MAKTDIPSKRLMQLRPDDWAKLALNDTSELKMIEMKPDKNPKVESRLDSLYWIEDEDGDYILNMEPQGYNERSLAARMLRYKADILEYTMNNYMGKPAIKQVVILFYPKDDNKDHTICDERFYDSNLSSQYNVIKVWELKKDYVIDNKLIGLYSLLPLMEVEDGETPEEILEKSVNMIETIEDGTLRADSMVSMSLMAEGKYSRTLIKKYIREGVLMKSTLYKEWISEDLKERDKKRIIELLESKFVFISKDIRNQIQNIESENVIDRLFDKVINIESIKEFEELLEKAKKLNLE